MPGTLENLTVIENVVKMLNAAYEQGKDDAKREVRDALGLETK